MKNLLLPFLLLISSFQLFSQGSFQKTYDFGDDYGNNVKKGNKAFFVAGSTSKAGAGSYDAMLMKFDTLGNLQWEKQVGGSNFEAGRALTSFQDGYIVAGSTNSYTVSPKNDAVISFFQSDTGKYEGSETIGFDSLAEQALDVTSIGDTALLIIGTTEANDINGKTNMFIIRTDNQAGPLWMRTFGTVNGNEKGLKIFNVPGPGFIGMGTSDAGGAGMSDAYIVNFDDSGHASNQILIGAAGDDDGRVFMINNNEIIIGGNTGSTSGPNRQNIFITALNPGNLSIIWSKTYGGDSATSLQSINVDNTDGNLVVGGSTPKFGAAGSAGLLFKVDSANGNVNWAKLIDGPGDDFIGGTQTLNDGSTVITGYSNSGSPNNNVYLARTNTTGALCQNTATLTLPSLNFTPSIVGPNVANHRDSAVAFIVTQKMMTLNTYSAITKDLCASTGIRTLATKNNTIQIYPNPTNGRLFIESAFGWSNNVNMSVYNMVGAEVFTKTIAAGTKDFNIDLSGSPKGMYIITFNDGNSITTEKVSLN